MKAEDLVEPETNYSVILVGDRVNKNKSRDIVLTFSGRELLKIAEMFEKSEWLKK